MNFSLLSTEKTDYSHRSMTMNGMRDELIKKKKRILIRELNLIELMILTLLLLFLIRLVVDTITVYIEHIQIKLITLFSSLTQLIKSVLCVCVFFFSS